MTRHREEEALTVDGWSRWVYPIMEGYKITCCDCGLVHQTEFRVTDDYTRVEFRVRRDNRATGQIRRHMGSTDEGASSRVRLAARRVLRDPATSKRAKPRAGRGLAV